MKKYLLSWVMAMSALSAHANQPTLDECQKIAADFIHAYAHDMTCSRHRLDTTSQDPKHILRPSAERLYKKVEVCQPLLAESFKKHPTQLDLFSKSLGGRLSVYENTADSQTVCQTKLPEVQSVLSTY